jgi:hypothetical protein
MEVPALAPGMKESVDKCKKKTEIQSQKWQYEIAHMYNYVLNNSIHHPQKWIMVSFEGHSQPLAGIVL